METPQPSRFEDSKPLLIAGVCRRYTYETMGEIPGQWAQFGPNFGSVPGQIGMVGYGVCSGGNSFHYLSGAEVSQVAGLPDDYYAVRLPAQKYAVFPHAGHVSTLCETIDAATNKWLPQSGYKLGDACNFFERYSEEFDPQVAVGAMEVWVPIKE
jgi:AraC family transcriptional regulator